MKLPWGRIIASLTMLFLRDLKLLPDMVFVIFSSTWHIGFARTLNLLKFSCSFVCMPSLSFLLHCTTKDYSQKKKIGGVKSLETDLHGAKVWVTFHGLSLIFMMSIVERQFNQMRMLVLPRKYRCIHLPSDLMSCFGILLMWFWCQSRKECFPRKSRNQPAWYYFSLRLHSDWESEM